ncbi:hypothetical protein CFOL_v3_26475 [Cephalotus follicularis]|uniref:Uncharacterized protein n=1 Tax=Cephalotus follicularis TaxID=3775 RepID=A0A1Q3CS01_CEPFO|nr:hypothetical protein CFOL_v3_26475 [Cephalotus follicularis]
MSSWPQVVETGSVLSSSPVPAPIASGDTVVEETQELVGVVQSKNVILNLQGELSDWSSSMEIKVCQAVDHAMSGNEVMSDLRGKEGARSRPSAQDIEAIVSLAIKKAMNGALGEATSPVVGHCRWANSETAT